VQCFEKKDELTGVRLTSTLVLCPWLKQEARVSYSA